MVLQDTWLFGGTIRENIAYGNLDATEEQILEAARATYVDRFVHSLPDGYDTIIDDEGGTVSAGEKQLLTIARAFLADPTILILDEATSSVDTRTEVLIQQAMAALRSQPHELRDRPPAVDHPRRRHHPRDGRRPASSSRATTTSCSPPAAPTPRSTTPSSRPPPSTSCDVVPTWQTPVMIERQVDVKTPDGEMTTFIFHPEHDGPHPVVLYLMDAPSIRPALKDMASRLGDRGLLRDAAVPLLPRRPVPGVRAERRGHARPTGAHGDGEPDEHHRRRRGAVGIRRRRSRRTRWQGGCRRVLYERRPRHRARHGRGPSELPQWRRFTGHGSCATRRIPLTWDLDTVRAEVYMAWVDGDPTAPNETIPIMEKAFDDAGVTYTIDLITGAVHGFAPPGERYDRAASELHWERVHSLFRRNL